jgi:ATP-dependent Clp protease ATP-binding subunit ClpX
VLLIGPSGCGKTHLASALAEIVKIPFHTIAAPGHSEAGYVGKMIDCSIGKALLKCRNQQAIIFIDEIDKVRTGATPGRDVSGEGVQQAILKLLEGGPAQAEDKFGAMEFSTQRTLWILAGAFQGLDAIRRRRLAKDAVGFGSSEGAQLGPITTDDLVNFGMLRELVGRCTQIVEMQALDSEAMLRAGWKLKGVFRRAKALFEAHGVALEFEEAAAKLIAERALSLNLGVRGLERVVMGIVQPALHRVLASNAGIGRVRVTPAAVDGGEPVLEPNGDESVYNVPWVKRLRDAAEDLLPDRDSRGD